MIFGFGKNKVSKLVARFPKAGRGERVSILGELSGSQKECVETALYQLQGGGLSQKDAEDILMGKIGSAEAVDYLFRLAEPEVSGVRMKVVRAAAGLENEDGRKLLDIMVKDADGDVAEEARRCLAGMMF